jgi:pimeloyl-ACP methyl ester carboxylesterase
VRRWAALFAAVLGLIAAGSAHAGTFRTTDAFFRADDGVQLAYTLYQPDGAAPSSGLPAVVLFHGLGGNRGTMAGIATLLASNGYVVLAFDARAHGDSGGLFSLNGPREMADTAELFEWLAARPGIDRTRIGAFGISLGGGAVWRSAAEGVPWAAIEPVMTWTDLYRALVPGNLVKTGIVFVFSQSVAGKIDPSLAPLLPDLLGSRNLAAIQPVFDARSTAPLLSRLRIPTFMLQGRTDFAFDIDQALTAYRLLPGPKRLYVGDLGHQPAPNPPAEQPYYAQECLQWFDRFLKGIPNGIDTRKPVELAAQPWNGKTASFAGVPPRTALRFTFPGTATIGTFGKVVRTVRLPKRALETFGAPSLTLRVGGTFTHVVAVLSSGSTVVSEGGTNLAAAATPRTVTIRMISTAVPLNARAKLTLTIAATSTAQNPNNALYLKAAPDGSKLTVGKATLSLPVLKKRVSP